MTLIELTPKYTEKIVTQAACVVHNLTTLYMDSDSIGKTCQVKCTCNNQEIENMYCDSIAS